jgi:hypothetical protein
MRVEPLTARREIVIKDSLLLVEEEVGAANWVRPDVGAISNANAHDCLLL